MNRIAVALFLAATAVSAQNLYPNPDFNDVDGSTGWQAGPGSIGLQEEDASGCPASGSLLASPAETAPKHTELAAVGPCLAFDEATTVDVRALYRAAVCGNCNFFVEIGLYENDACLTFPFRNVYANLSWTPDWLPLEGTFEVPAGGSIGMKILGGGVSSSAIEIDEIRVTAPGYLFLDDFEGGGTCRWSASAE